MKKLFISSKGLTLVELLMALSLVSIILIVIMNYIISGMNSYEKTSHNVSLHNDGNYVMSLFVNTIYKATKIEQEENDFSKIEIENLEGERVELGFKDEGAYIKYGDKDSINLSNFYFSQGEGSSCEEGESGSCINLKEETVFIKLVIESEKSESKMELINEVSFGKSKEVED